MFLLAAKCTGEVLLLCLAVHLRGSVLPGAYLLVQLPTLGAQRHSDFGSLFGPPKSLTCSLGLFCLLSSFAVERQVPGPAELSKHR